MNSMLIYKLTIQKTDVSVNLVKLSAKIRYYVQKILLDTRLTLFLVALF